MNLGELYIRLFRKHEAVIIKRLNESGRLTTHWAVPNPDNVVKLLDVDDGILLHKDSRLLSTKRNIPTYIVTYEDCQPITLDDLKRKGIYSTAEIHLILENDLAQKSFKAGNKSKISDEAKLIIVVIIIGFLVLGYFLNTKLMELKPVPEPDVLEVFDSE